MENKVDQANKVLLSAKLTESDVYPVSEIFTFHPEFAEVSDFKLLELNQHLEEELEKGDTLYINGSSSDNTVLCTNTNTFNVFTAETSNSLLISNGLKLHNNIKDEKEKCVHDVTVVGISYEYFVVAQIKPDFNKVKQLLSTTVYRGKEHEYEVDESKLLTFEDLWMKTQASKEELKSTIKDLNVVTINNKLRILEFEYHFRVLSFMLKLIDEFSWNLEQICYEETVNSLVDLVPSDIINSMFSMYTEETKMIDGVQLYRYKEREVCRFFAQVLLYSAGKFNFKDFMQAWEESVPEGMKVEENMLHGIALINRKSMPNVIWMFSEFDLPDTINDRFKVLFEAKERWSYEEIAPYIARLTTDKLDVNALLAKHARNFKVNDVKYYSSKHLK
ncbi:PREDICTED: sister chromatid cohesion protein DCC1 [Nicrophorus vespilloides]|uniref:Sister chromatid cohesion protein DCC1 n=1 Tax=Nicrophorus vespilloides TaxID=110193 RepID=A0ABM1MT42_NICVS|nr:PREDICTED: sister chromatid cohesion protein DCC1 [Nicrophorus vespilloides]